MNFRSKFVCIAGVVLAAFLAGYWSRGRMPAVPGTAGPAARKVLYWHDPMHPAYKSDKPGIAPDCGMQLEPVYEGDAVAAVPVVPGTVQISAEKQQLMGIRLATVQRTAASRTLRVP